jgi:GNAT superfamily N-acetyltransferase
MTLTPDLELEPPLSLERLADGGLVAFRAAQPSGADDELLHALALDYAETTRVDRPMGFVSMTRPLPRSLRGIARVDALDDCILAIEPRTGIPLGMAALTGTRGRTAQPWVMVRRSSRRRGVGMLLLEGLAARAREQRLRRLRMRLSVAEPRMLLLLHRLGAACRPDGAARDIEAEIPIDDADEGAGVTLGATLWAVARGGLLPSVPVRPAA